ncbi:MAG: hypothetical protein AB7O66_12555, partial [Limisphaerales bacterium]
MEPVRFRDISGRQSAKPNFLGPEGRRTLAGGKPAPAGAAAGPQPSAIAPRQARETPVAYPRYQSSNSGEPCNPG